MAGNADIGISAILVVKQELYTARRQRYQEFGLSRLPLTLRLLAVLAGGRRLLLRSPIMRRRTLLLLPRVTLLEPAAMKVVAIRTYLKIADCCRSDNNVE
jgi:hypothetical protein